MMILYGIPNCDSVKKARKWLESQLIDYQFHDYKKQGVDEAALRKAIAQHSLDVVLNKRGRTWKMMDENQQAMAAIADGAVVLMMEHSSLIKRPIMVNEEQVLVGFNEAQWSENLK